MHVKSTLLHFKQNSFSCHFPFQNGQQLYRHIYLGCKEEDNVQKNYELLYTSLALITIELANEEVVIDLIRLAIALQVCLHNSSFWESIFELDTVMKVLLPLSKDVNFKSEVPSLKSKILTAMVTFIYSFNKCWLSIDCVPSIVQGHSNTVKKGTPWSLCSSFQSGGEVIK